MLDALRIPSGDQTKLFNTHGITNYQSLKRKQYQLDRRTLEGVDPVAQRIVASALVYLDSLQCDDPLPKFSKQSWMVWAATIGEPAACVEASTTVGGGEGGSQAPAASADAVKITLESEMIDKCQVSEETKNPGGDVMEVDEDNADDKKIGRSTNLGHIRPTRDLDHQVKDEAEMDSDDEEDPEQKTGGKFDMISQGFSPNEAGLFDVPTEHDTSNKDEEHLDFVDFKGKRLYKRKCYHFVDAEAKDDEDSAPIIVGIRQILRNRKTKRIRFVCVKVVPITQTFLGHGDNGDFQAAVSKHYHSRFVQVKGERSLKAAELGPASSDPPDMPHLIYEPQTARRKQMLAYVRDNEGYNIVRVRRPELRLIEGFAGAGGMHLGYEEEGFTTVQAIEYNDAAVTTFKHNNPGVPVYHGDIQEFIRQMEDDDFRTNMGRIDVIHTSSPCQGFSKANRNGGQNDDANNRLSYTFVDLLRLTDALVGTFENVEGMWTKKGMPYLRKILVDCIALGYQVRVKILRCCDYGDVQKRPRLIIIAAKHYVPMPPHPAHTHGPGKLPYVTTKNVLAPLCRENLRGSFPNMEDVGPKNFNEGESIQLVAHSFSPAVLAKGSEIFHYEEHRPLNMRERAALQSFPYNYEFLGTQTEQKRQIGNAVPVELSRAIARTVRDSLRYGYIEEIEAAMMAAGEEEEMEAEETNLEEEEEEVNIAAEGQGSVLAAGEAQMIVEVEEEPLEAQQEQAEDEVVVAV